MLRRAGANIYTQYNLLFLQILLLISFFLSLSIATYTPRTIIID